MHYTISNSQNEILGSISEMYLKGERIHLDLCYNVGGFYSPAGSRIQDPEIKNDLHLGSGDYSPAGSTLTGFDCRETNLGPETIRSVVFDPPFLVGENIMTERYGGFDSITEMFSFQESSLLEISRILKKGGFLITKVQDFCHGRQKYFPSIYQVIKARECGLYLIDSFILVNKNRFRAKSAGRLTAVSAHCFFHVFQKEARRKRIFRY
jgi:DNA methylase